MFDGILYFLILVVIGYFALKCKLLPEQTPDILSAVLLVVCFPAMILNSFLTIDAQTLFTTGLPTLIVTLIFSLLPFFVLLFGKQTEKKRLFRFICGVGNASFVCIPLLGLFLTSEEMFPVYVHVAVQDLLIWCLFHPLYLGEGQKIQWKKLLTEPSLLAVFVGFILALAQVRLPSFLLVPIEALEGAVSPLALLFLGMIIARYGILSWRGSRDAIYYTLFKVLLYPCLVFAALYFILPLKTALLLALLFGSPAPAAAVIWSQRYGRDTKLAVSCLIPSTIAYFFVAGAALVIFAQMGIFG